MIRRPEIYPMFVRTFVFTSKGGNNIKWGAKGDAWREQFTHPEIEFRCGSRCIQIKLSMLTLDQQIRLCTRPFGRVFMDRAIVTRTAPTITLGMSIINLVESIFINIWRYMQ